MSQEYGKSVFPRDVEIIKKDVYFKVIQNNDMETLTTIMKDNNSSLDRELVTELIKYDRADFLKSLLINPQFEVNKENNSNNAVSILNPDVLFLMAAKSGAVNTMKFALEFNGEIFSQETLNMVAKSALENKDYVMLKYMKDRSSLIELEAPNVVIPTKEELSNKLDSKIERLRNISYPSTNENGLKNT